MYHVMQQAIDLLEQFAYFRDSPDNCGFEIGMFETGQPFPEAPQPMKIASDPDCGVSLSDLLITNFTAEILSARFRSILADAGVSNIEYFSIEVINSASGETDSTYKIANILGRIPCLDQDNSTIRTMRSGIIRSIKRFQILQQRIDEWTYKEGLDDTPSIFRLDELPRVILVKDTVCTHLEKEKLTGVNFVKTTEFIG